MLQYHNKRGYDETKIRSACNYNKTTAYVSFCFAYLLIWLLTIAIEKQDGNRACQKTFKLEGSLDIMLSWYSQVINLPQVIQIITETNQRIVASFVNKLEVWKFKILSNSAISSSSALEALIRVIPLRDEERWLNIGDRLMDSTLCTALKYIFWLCRLHVFFIPVDVCTLQLE